MAAPSQVTFACGVDGLWHVEAVERVTGAALPLAGRLAVLEGHVTSDVVAWALRGTTGHQRYTTRAEKGALGSVQPVLGRAASRCASLIPIRKSDAWWELAQDERRAIFEDASHHISASMKYLPAIARRLYHSRELGEPFDFLTWFEYAPDDASHFDDLLAMLRATEEWRYVEREVHVRLQR
jgi:hypothetical protein